jgi:sugar lactone lactonase YvrE
VLARQPPARCEAFEISDESLHPGEGASTPRDSSIHHSVVRDVARPAHYAHVKTPRFPVFVTIAVLLAASKRGAAQEMTGIPAVDSAAVARAAWGRAAKALSQDDVSVARREIERAAESWPTQSTYLWADAVLAARAGDTVTTLHALEAYAGLGLGRDLHGDPSVARLTTLPAFARIVAAHDAHRAPVVHSRERASLGDSSFWPEGVDYDPRTGRLYVASVRHRTIAELRPDGSSRELLPRDTRSLGAILGVRVDTTRGVLWATTSGIPQMLNYTPGDSRIAALLRIRVSDGTIERRWDIRPVPGGHVLGDLAIGPRGDVFLTDSNEPVLYRLRPGADSIETIRSPLFHSLQGMAPAADGRRLYVADYSHGMLSVDLATRAVTRVSDAPGSTSLGCDGIVWDRGAIIAVQNGVSPARIVRFVLDVSGTRFIRADVLDQNYAIADEPTIGTIANGEFVYVANSQWDKHDAAGNPLPGRSLTPPKLLAIPLPP